MVLQSEVMLLRVWAFSHPLAEVVREGFTKKAPSKGRVLLKEYKFCMWAGGEGLLMKQQAQKDAIQPENICSGKYNQFIMLGQSSKRWKSER